MRVAFLVLAFLAIAGAASAASSEIRYGKPPAWAAPPPSPTQTAAPPGAALQVVYSDNQVRLGPDADEFYSAYRFKVLTSEGLPVGNITASWNPNTDDLRVHFLRVIRDGEVIDVLKTTKFEVIRRENNLEYAMLNGALTAALQTPGLRVGDEIEFATTVSHRDPTLGERAQGVMALPPRGGAGAYRMRLFWSDDRKVVWSATPDLGDLKPVAVAGGQEVSVELRDPESAILADGAPLRVNLRRRVEFSGFSNWAEVSNLLWPLYEQASRLAPDSPVRAEAARIAASTDDPIERAAAALALVQERIRYVYVGLDGGNFRPAPADETWTRRFGDCKAKTALLLALLRELGVTAEAALVDSSGGDGMNERLPMPGAFDHVLVKATIEGETYWLDGTRMGDRRLSLLPPPVFRWALAVRGGAAELEPVEPEPPLLALNAVVLEIDARDGIDKPAKVSVEEVFRGDDALAFKTMLSQFTPGDLERALRAYWMDEYRWITPEETSWRYDEDQNMTVLTMTGEGRPEWEGDEQDGHWLQVSGASFSRPAELRRPKEQDQNAPWVTGFPAYRRLTTVVRLPPAGEGWSWGYFGPDVDMELGATAYWRSVELRDDVLRSIASVRIHRPEITAEEAREANERRTELNNRYTRIFRYRTPSQEELLDAAKTIRTRADGDAAALVKAAAEISQSGLQDEALKTYEQALATEPGHVGAILGKAWVLEARDGPEAALQFLERAAGDSTDPKLVMARVGAMTRSDRMEDAVELIEAVTARHKDDPELMATAAHYLLAAGRHDLAGRAADTAVKLDGEDHYVRQVSGAIHAAAKRWEEALIDLDAALRLQPENPVNFRNRAQALRRLGRYDEALADVEEALRIDPRDDPSLFRMAEILKDAGRQAEALALYDRAVEDDGGPASLNNRCWARALANVHLEGAEADCAKAVELAPDSGSFWDSYALVAFRRDDFDEARRRYDKALSLNPKLAPSLYGRGLTRLRLGDEAGGRADIAAARAMAPTVGDELSEAGITP